MSTLLNGEPQSIDLQ